jgi:hypothetical protein
MDTNTASTIETQDHVVNYYEIVLHASGDRILARLRYQMGNEMHESQLYTVSEINCVRIAWLRGELLGSFGMHKLAPDALFQLIHAQGGY